MRTIALAFTVFSLAVSTSSGAEIHKLNKLLRPAKSWRWLGTSKG